MRYDAIVIGLGAMGSATAMQLAKRGASVLGIDRHAPPHAHGTHCGETRITRKAIGVDERVMGVAQDGDGVAVATERGTYRAASAIACAGAGVVELVPELAARFTVSRQMQYWFEAAGLDDIPVWIWELQDRGNAIYGF